MVRHFHSLPKNLKLFLIGHAFLAFGISVHGLLFNLFLREEGFKEGVMGSLAATSSLGIALVAFPAAFVLERFAVKPLILVGSLLCALLYIMQVQSSSVEAYTTFGVLGAMGLALFHVSTAPFIYRHAPTELRVYAFTLNGVAAMGSQLIAYMVGGFIPDLLQVILPALQRPEAYKWSMSLSLLVSLSSLLCFAQILKAPIPKIKRNFIGEVKEKDWKSLGTLIAPKVCIGLGAGMIIPFINVYLVSGFGLESSVIGICFGILQVFIFLGIYLSPIMVKKFDRLQFIIISAALSVPFMLIMAFTTSIPLVLGSFFLRGMLMNMSAPVTSLFEMEHVREKECLFASSMLIFCYNTAWTFSTEVGGWLIENHGFKISFIIAAGFYMSAVGFYFRFFKLRKMKSLSCNGKDAIEAA